MKKFVLILCLFAATCFASTVDKPASSLNPVQGDFGLTGWLTVGEGATIGTGTDSSIIMGANLEEITGSTDGLICIEGHGGSPDNEICFEVDGAFPKLSSLSGIIGVAESLEVDGGIAANVTEIDGPYSVMPTDFAIYGILPAATGAQVALPLSANVAIGKIYFLKYVSGDDDKSMFISVGAFAGTIDGAATYVIDEGSAVIVQHTGSNEYKVLAVYNPPTFKTLTTSGNIVIATTVWYLDSNGGTVTGQLPSTIISGDIIYIKAINGAGKIDPDGKTIDRTSYPADPFFQLADEEGIQLQYDGAGWNIIGRTN